MTIAGAHDAAPPHPPVRPEAAFVRHAYAPFPLRVEELVHEIPGARLATTGASDARITGVHHDSRRIEPGDLFVARAGAHADGARFVAEAVTRGARAVLATREVPVAGVAKIEVDDVPSGLAYASAAVYGHPTFGLEVVGITGTNGKTTTAHLVQAVIAGCGGRAGIIGTLGARFADLDLPPTLTSPEADELARIAAAMRARGAEHLVMEVSSIALIARRSDAVRFRVAAFTNLTQDHLDYHGSMEAYAEAKARLFVDLAPGSAAINVDDPFGRELARRVAPADGPRSVVLARFSTRTSAGPDEAEVA
ncbi:MAG: Mur ligase family protein, partial [Byssovorax sp.]